MRLEFVCRIVYFPSNRYSHSSIRSILLAHKAKNFNIETQSEWQKSRIKSIFSVVQVKANKKWFPNVNYGFCTSFMKIKKANSCTISIIHEKSHQFQSKLWLYNNLLNMRILSQHRTQQMQ